MDEFDNFCRACLVQYDDVQDLISYTESRRRQFIYSTGIQIKQNDIFPFNLCKNCHNSMVYSCKFRKQCRNSEKRIRNYLNTKDSVNLDFRTFLANNDDSFRLPYKKEYAQEINEKEDDNVSTSTSIKSFMNNLLIGTDIPAEETLIKQVIAEIDILEDTLDSNWMGDDENQFILPDFSPFATPNTKNEDRCTTPLQTNEDIFDPFVSDHCKDKPKYAEINSYCNTRDNQYENENVKIKDVIDQNLDAALENGESSFDLDDLLKSPANTTSTPHHEPNFHPKNFNVISSNIMNFYESYAAEIQSTIDEPTNIVQENATIDKNNEITNESNEHQIIPTLEPIVPPVDNTDISHELNQPNKIMSLAKPENNKQLPLKPTYNEKLQLKCMTCNLNFGTFQLLFSHFNNNHQVFRNFLCPICHQVFNSKRQVNLHVKASHNGKKHCEACDRFVDIVHFDTHMKRHNKSFTVYCDMCNKGFVEKYELVEHIKRHYPYKTFKCNICKWIGKTRKTLYQHNYRLHSDSRKKPGK